MVLKWKRETEQKKDKGDKGEEIPLRKKKFIYIGKWETMSSAVQPQERQSEKRERTVSAMSARKTKQQVVSSYAFFLWDSIKWSKEKREFELI